MLFRKEQMPRSPDFIKVLGQVLRHVLKHSPKYMPAMLVLDHMHEHMLALAQAPTSHVFATSIYYGLNVENSPNLLMRVTTCDQLILISHYYITMKSTCFNHKNRGLLRTSAMRGITNGGS